MSHASTNMKMAISYLMLSIKMIYFHQLSNVLEYSNKQKNYITKCHMLQQI